MASARSRFSGAVLLSLLSVYLIWGSTYLAQRIALQTFPPFLMGGVRFSLAGCALYAFLRLRGVPAPTRVEWRSTALVGALLLVGGNGGMAYAQLFISSGVAAIVVATMPLWAVLFAAFWGNRPSRAELFGLVLGLSGVALLQQGGAFHGSWFGFVAIVLAPMAWALGSVWGARLSLPKGPMASAAQMLWGGLFMTLLALVRGESMRPWALPTVAAFAYLVIFGSLVAFRAYGYLLEHTRPAVATSYAFVNPSVALLLGAWLAGEALELTTVVACALTVAGVVVVILGRSAAKP